MPKTPADLLGHDFVVVVTSSGPLSELNFVRGEERYAFSMPVADSWESNDGALQMVLPDWCTHEAAVHALFHANRYMAPRVRVLLDFLVERFEKTMAELLGDLAYPPDRVRERQEWPSELYYNIRLNCGKKRCRSD